MLLGEAISKLEHVAGVPLQPKVAAELNTVYLTKGAHATTQIEGNTLSEADVRKRVDHELPLPPSQEYLGQEIDNVIQGYNQIVDEVVGGTRLALHLDRICEFNKIVLNGLPADGDGKPGEIRTTSVLVGAHYRGAPAEDCEYLIDRMCTWLDDLRSTEGSLHQPVSVLAAIMAHLYIAWIHPFEDGNGRTARLIEYQMMVQAGAPTLAAHVLADHYNKTRAEYYRQLRRTSMDPFDVSGFIKYALQGLVDGLRQQIGEIQGQQMNVTWRNYVHEAFHDKTTPACARQRRLLLSLPVGEWTKKSDIRGLTPLIAEAYAGKEDKTISRDINALAEMNLILKTGRSTTVQIAPRTGLLRAFMPVVADRD
ncbi:Fic family protein [Streptomyces bacillaris]|uniref:Fic family protein n=1 Tax=Streptomyces bacillaris TaxID=68179 RepID=UPI0036FF75EA